MTRSSGRTSRTWGAWLPAAVALVACSGGGGANSDGGTGASPGGPHGVPPPSTGPGASQLTVTLQNTRRHGDTILFTVKGSDPAGQTTEAHVRLLDSSNMPVTAFDTNWDGIADSAEQRLHFDQSTLGQKTFTQTITLPELYANHPSIASAVVSLSDASGKLSLPVTATLFPQPVDQLGDACDPNVTTDRCAEGMGCSGKPPTCQAGAAPTIASVAYFGGANPTELFVGTDHDEDLATITVNFLDAAGKSLTIDLSGSGNFFASSIVLDATGATGQTFFLDNDPVARFASMVPKISAVTTDSLGRTGAPVVATLAIQPLQANGQSCDPRGFTACAIGLACSPGVVGAANTCAGVPRLQADKCNAAPLSTATGVLAAWGLAGGPSLWDPPPGCSNPAYVNRSEGVVALKLDHAATTLTLSTATPETDFDTILYVLPGCPSSSKDALGCNDNAQGYASTVTLTNVPAGVYLVVVDSAGPHLGHFGLTVSAQ
jgi:hypothetical protein